MLEHTMIDSAMSATLLNEIVFWTVSPLIICEIHIPPIAMMNKFQYWPDHVDIAYMIVEQIDSYILFSSGSRYNYV